MLMVVLIMGVGCAAITVALFSHTKRTVAKLRQLIAEQRTADLALRASESFLARTGAVAGIGGWEFDIREKVLTWSDETKRLFGVVSSYRPTVEGALRFYKPEAIPMIQRHFEACIEAAEPCDLELEILTAEGRSLWTRLTSTAEFEAGVAVRVVGAVQDVTARKTLERDLAESNDLVRVTLNSIGDAVITTDPAGHVVWLNPVAERLTGWAKDEARSKPLKDVFNLTDAETGQPSLDPVAACLSEGKSVALQSRTTLHSRQGEEYGIEDSASPIRNAEGEILGAVLVFHDVSEQRRLSVQMNHRATHDPLTGLTNRAEFEHRLSRLLEEARLEARGHVLMYIDLDDFKVINDACGHAAGDQLLRQVGMLLQAAIRGRDTAARLGGDEFGVILEMCNIEQGRLIAQKICSQIEVYRFAHDQRTYRVGASIGVVPVDLRWQSSATVLQTADSCCYAAKNAGRNRVHLWTESDSTLMARQQAMQWTSRLEAAIDENRFVLFAQHIEPMRGATTGLHCEVLLRLREDDGPMILAGSFLPAAARFHLMARIDRWVLHKVFEMLEGDAIELERIDTITVHLSGQSIADRAFHRDVICMLQEARFDTHKLCFEITEAAAITNFGDAKRCFEEVRSHGVRIALDDFGAGATSFGYLRMLPIDYFKIDRQFITGLDDPLNRAAVRCFCDVAKAVGVKTIAGFVERSDTRDTLNAIGVNMVQGFLIHHPEPLARMLRSGRRRSNSGTKRRAG